MLQISFCQSTISGRYMNPFGKSILLQNDSTFYYQYSTDIYSTWSVGEWRINNDTISLHITPIYDTLHFYDSLNHIYRDTLVLSDDLWPNKINNYVFSNKSYGQNHFPCPITLYYKSDKLFYINNGKINNKKENNGITTENKKYPHYEKHCLLQGKYLVTYKTKQCDNYTLIIYDNYFTMELKRDTIKGVITYGFNSICFSADKHESINLELTKRDNNTIKFRTIMYHDYKIKTINKGYLIKID